MKKVFGFLCNSSELFLCAFLLIITNFLIKEVSARNVKGRRFSRLAYQPELDQLSLENYVTNEDLFNAHIRCLFYNGPCDPVGRWMQPRMASNFLGACILCTPNQEKEADKFITFLYHNHPQLFRKGIEKYLKANGISLPENSKFSEAVQKMNVPKIGHHNVSPSDDNKDQDENKNSEGSSEILLTSEKQISNSQQQQQPQHGQEGSPVENSGFSSSNNSNRSDGSGPTVTSNPIQRVQNPISRKNKFTNAMSSFGFSESPIEDDEADDMQITTRI